MEKAVKRLTPLPSTGCDCPYALMLFNGDACHVPVPKEGHPEHPGCSRHQQHHLWKGQSTTGPSTPQLVFPDSLSGRTQWVWGPCDSLPTIAYGQRSQPTWQWTYLPEGVHHPVQPGGARTQSSATWWSPPSILIASPARPPLPKAEGEVSMTMEVRELLFQAVLDTSEHASGSSIPKRWEPMVLVTPLPTKMEDFPKPVDMSSQLSAPNDAEKGDASLKEIPTPSSPTAEALGPSSDAPPSDVAHLLEEANKALGDLLVIKSYIDAHWQKLVSEFGMALHEKDSETMESIKEAKAICTHSIQEAENCCSVDIREVEVQRASQAASIQHSHHKAVQHCEEESERKCQLNLLSICQTALWASPPEFHSVLVASYHILLRHAPMSHLFSIPQGASPFPPGSIPGTSSPPAPEHSPRPKQHHCPDPMDALPLSGSTSQATPKGPSTSKWQEMMPLHKALRRSC